MANSATYNHTKIHFAEGAAAATPDSGEVVIYAKTDGHIYQKDDAGTETDLAAGGGGGSVPQPWAIPPLYGGGRAATASVGAAERGIWVPIWIPVDSTITGVRLKIENATGNGDVGIYNAAGSRLAAHGGGAWPGTGIQTISFSSPYSASAGRYYLAVSASSNTASFAVCNVGATSGAVNAKFMASAYPLPTTFTSAGETSVSLDAWGIIDGISY